MKQPSRVQFADERIKKAFEDLLKSGKECQEMHVQLMRAFTEIEENAFCGIQVPKKLIPKYYIKKYHVHNLWKYNLPGAWRLLYSIESDGLIVISIVLEWANHKGYERRFRY